MRRERSTHGTMYYIGEVFGIIARLVTGMKIMLWLLSLF